MSEKIEFWAVLSMMGHLERVGYLREVEVAGVKMLRIDIPTKDGDVTEFYGAHSVYSIQPIEEQIARDRGSDFRGVAVRPKRYAETPALEAPKPGDVGADFHQSEMDRINRDADDDYDEGEF